MIELRLTERRIADLPTPREAYRRHWDAEVRGLGVKVFSSGRKIYVFKDRLHGKTLWGKKMPLCSEASLAEMRVQALEWKAQIRRGENPWNKDTVEPRQTVFDLCRENLESKRQQKNPKPIAAMTLKFYERLVAEIERSDLGSMQTDLVGPAEAKSFLRAFRGKARYHDGLRFFLSNSFQGAEEALTDPFKKVPKRYALPAPNQLPRFTDAEIERLCDALRKAERGETAHTYDPVFIHFVWFLIRVGTRPSETLKIERDWLDSVGEQAVIWHPSTKTGFMPILLSESALEVVKSASRICDSRFLFPGKLGHLKTYAKPFARLAGEADLPHRSPYAIRRWFARTGRLAFKGDVAPIQMLLDWESSGMAMRYSGEDKNILESLVTERADISDVVAERVDQVAGSQLPNSYHELPKRNQKDTVKPKREEEAETPSKGRSAGVLQRKTIETGGSAGGIRTPDQLINSQLVLREDW